MRSLLSLFLFVCLSAKLVAGGFDPYKVDPKFEKEIGPLLITIDSVGAIAYAAVLPTFKQLSEKYPKEWRSYYWEALANIRKAEIDSLGEKDQLLNEAERLINRAEMFIKQNPELYLLRAWMLKMRIDVDPSSREPKYKADFNWYMEQAYKIDQGNPRYYFLRGLWSENDTTEAGKKITFRYYRSAKLLFQDRPQGKYLAEPDWGRGETDLALGLLMPAYFNIEDPTGEIANAIADSLRKAEKETKKEGPKETLKEEDVPKEMIGAELPESLLNEDAGTIKVTDKGAVYSPKSIEEKEGKIKKKKDKKDKSGDDKKEDKAKDEKADKKDKKDKSSKVNISGKDDPGTAGDGKKGKEKDKKSSDKSKDKSESKSKKTPK